MQDYAAMNHVYTEMIPDPKPARTCVAVADLPFGTDVSTRDYKRPRDAPANQNTGRNRVHSTSVSRLDAPCLQFCAIQEDENDILLILGAEMKMRWLGGPRSFDHPQVLSHLSLLLTSDHNAMRFCGKAHKLCISFLKGSCR